MASPFDLCALAQRRLKAHVFESLPKGDWYVTVVDRNALKVVSSHLKMSDLLEFNVSVVDPLEKGRRAAKNVVYIISPLVDSMKRVLEDFQGPKPLYENVRLYFTSKASDKVLQMLKSCPSLVRRLMALKEIHTEFQNVDGRTFITGSSNALANLFGRDLKPNTRQDELAKTAQRMATVFAAIKSRPSSITVRVPTELPDLPNSEARRSVCKYDSIFFECLQGHHVRLGLYMDMDCSSLCRVATFVTPSSCRDLGAMVQDKVSKLALADPTLFSAGACDLIILDRGHDPVAPVIHPFHYAAITHDLVPLSNGVFKYTWQNAQGEEQSSEHVVDSTDPMWAELRHSHVAEVVQVATARLKEFTSSRLARVERPGSDKASLANAASSLPEYLAKKSHLSMHVQLTHSIFSSINRRDLIPLGRLEQELVFGEKKGSDIFTQLHAWNSGRAEGSPTREDIMRLLLCYFATHPGKLDAKHQESWSSIARLTDAQMHTICSLQFLGVELQKQKKRTPFSFSRRKANRPVRVERSADARALENGRFQPMLAETFNSFVCSKLATGPGKEFDVIAASTEFDTVPQTGAASLGAKSVRTSNRPQPTWHRRAASSGSNAGPGANVDDVLIRTRKVVVFIVGGCTWSEIQCAHELSQQHGVEVVLGSTGIIEGGEEFLQQMKTLASYDSPEALAIDMP